MRRHAKTIKDVVISHRTLARPALENRICNPRYQVHFPTPESP
jgi:hypothetical protein